MLPAGRRIRRKDFKKIFSQGLFFSGKDISMVTLRFPGGTASKFVFSVSKKVAKGAVVRNSLRRKGYSVVRELIPKIAPSFFIVFIFNRLLEKKELARLKQKIEKLLQEADLLS
jgi:ribonuclease P protein component